MATVSRFMSEEEFLALPEDDGIERELIRGELRERPKTTRAYAHSILVINIGLHLKLCNRQRPEPREPWSGQRPGFASVEIHSTFVGVDVAYISPAARPAHPRKAGYVDGPPVLVVEVLSPSDKQEEIADKVAEYLDAGVPIVWIVDPSFSTVTVYRPDAKPQLFNADQEITAEPHLPGLRVAVADFFEDLD